GSLHPGHAAGPSWLMPAASKLRRLPMKNLVLALALISAFATSAAAPAFAQEFPNAYCNTCQ
ncbi:MAG TPA: hypothetical protein VIQ39_00960, partial [Methyloceanibacter sp.]